MATDVVIIIGAGPVGQTTALLLARWGIASIVLDARPHRDAVGSKAICQQRDVLDVWESVGAGEAIAREGVTWSRARTYYRGHELACLEYSDESGSPFPAWVNISQTRTEAILDERIKAQPLIELRFGHRVVSVGQDDDGVRVLCETADGPVVIAGAYGVACTGARDRVVHEHLGVQMLGHTFSDQFVICDLKVDMPEWQHERRFYFDPPWNPGRQVLIHACPDQTFRIDWQVPGDFDFQAELESGAHAERIRRIIGERPYTVVWQSAYRFHSRHVDRMRVGRVLLAGDAAHLVSPFGARGLNSGVADAENAAWKLAFVIKGFAPAALLESYHQERLAAALENIEVTDQTMRFLVPRDEREHTHRREVLDRALTDVAARREIDSGRMAEPYWYPASPLTTPDPKRPVACRPPPGKTPPPGPGVLLPDHPIAHPARRLRALVRDGLLALCADGSDVARIGEGLRRATRAPSTAHAVSTLDPTGALSSALDLTPQEVWLVRPDGHVAATLRAPSPQALADAVHRCTTGAPP